MVKKYTIGYLYPKSIRDYEDELLIKLLKRKFNVLLFPLEEQINEKQIEERAKLCSLVLNGAVHGPFTMEAIELSKTFEEFGIKVINSSHSFYYQEDRWMLYLKCLEHNIPTPLTYFIPKELNYNRGEIKKILEEGAIVIKAIFSDGGACVERAKTFEEFNDKIKKIINKNPVSPVIAQKYLDHGNTSYRVTLVGNKIVQSIVKIGKTWEQTGTKKTESYRTFKPDEKLKKLCEKVSKILEMEWCGLDLLKYNGNWYIIEANCCPSTSFVVKDMGRINEVLVDYLYQKVEKLSK